MLLPECEVHSLCNGSLLYNGVRESWSNVYVRVLRGCVSKQARGDNRCGRYMACVSAVLDFWYSKPECLTKRNSEEALWILGSLL